MCKFLGVNRSIFYYKPKNKSKAKQEAEDRLEQAVVREFKSSRNNYGTRKLKVQLSRLGMVISRRKIGAIMAKNGLVSNYTIKQFKKHKHDANQTKIDNVVQRKFSGRKPLEVVVSDLTYVNVRGKWHYICLIIDIAGREIIGYSAGKNKDANLIEKAFYSMKAKLSNIQIFHTDRGSEFNNQSIDRIIKTFGITRSLSRKGNPYDNAVAEATYKIIKTEFAFNRIFDNFEQLQYLLFDYVHWFNHIRIHSSLGYLSPAQFKQKSSTINCPILR